MKMTLAAALTAATLATPAAADDVFDCFIDTLDDQIETMTSIFESLVTPQTSEFYHDETISGSVEATYDTETKEQMIADCEESTGQQSNGFSEGITLYSNGGPVTLHFQR